ncbi:hypothetical protein N826_39810 [Skermanella aerolata KACC 11604]|nr:hypothetical protein N826_39810 [Skermanella aerolata KACC 11604]
MRRKALADIHSAVASFNGFGDLYSPTANFDTDLINSLKIGGGEHVTRQDQTRGIANFS